MHRSPTSHKGENGTVAIIGGSAAMHGAPLFSALAAEASGVDLLHVCVPLCHAQIARMHSLNFQVHSFAGDELQENDIDALLHVLATVDAAVVGPGLARDARTLMALRSLIISAPCPLVVDASALQPWTLAAVAHKNAIVTPHLGELERMGIQPQAIDEAATDAGVVIHLKGPVDRIALADGGILENAGGNAGLTVGGTGDALAGLIASLRAQGAERQDACLLASTVIKRAGALLMHEKGMAYTTRDVIGKIPEVFKGLGG